MSIRVFIAFVLVVNSILHIVLNMKSHGTRSLYVVDYYARVYSGKTKGNPLYSLIADWPRGIYI